MITSVTLTNHRNESLNISLANPWESGLAITSIDGLNPPKATLNFTELSSADGSVFNSSRIGARYLVFKFKILEQLTIEEARHILYKYLPIQQYVKITIHSTTRDVFTTGYVESNEITIFSQSEEATVSITCNDPYLYSVDEIVTPLLESIGGFEFPFENEVGEYQLHFGETHIASPALIFYEGDRPTGIRISLYANDVIGDLRFYSITSNEEIYIDSDKLAEKTGSGIVAGDVINISTVTGKKSITLTRAGVIYNILSCIDRNSGWIKLYPGDNILVSTGTGINNSSIRVYHNSVFEGI